MPGRVLVGARSITTDGASSCYRLELRLPYGVSFMESAPPADVGGLLRWTVNLASQAMFRLDALLRLPEEAGDYHVLVEESRAVAGNYQVNASATQVYTVDANPTE
ncbi:MAG: hypothetical protein HY698_14850, partial [Deltaproteobacteria bacterium]|nr:hypothetical protein [Deltaproteobacteria bacterium]